MSADNNGKPDGGPGAGGTSGTLTGEGGPDGSIGTSGPAGPGGFGTNTGDGSGSPCRRSSWNGKAVSLKGPRA